MKTSRATSGYTTFVSYRQPRGGCQPMTKRASDPPRRGAPERVHNEVDAGSRTRMPVHRIIAKVRAAMIAGSLALVMAIVPPRAGGDDWPGPVTLTRFSDGGEFFVRISPGTSVGDTFGFASGTKGRYARARFYALQPDQSYRLIREAALLNPVAPVDAVVSRRGDLITLDNWHNIGYGKVLAVYDSSGRNVIHYELEQLYPVERIKRLRESVSSRYWRCAPVHFVDPVDQTELYIREALGGYFVLRIDTGAITYHAGQIPECVLPEVPRR